MRLSDKEAVKALSLPDFLYQRTKEDLLNAADRLGMPLSEKSKKGVLVKQLAALYTYYPHKLLPALETGERRYLAAMFENDCEGAPDASAQSLEQMGLVFTVGEADEPRRVVCPRLLCQIYQNKLKNEV